MTSSFRIAPFAGTRRESAAINGLYRSLVEALYDEPEQASDYEARVSTQWRASGGSAEPSSYDLRRVLAYDEQADEAIGYGQAFHPPWAFDPQRYHVTVRVHPEHQRQGVGSALHDALLADLRGRGATTVRAEVDEIHASGLAFAEKHGWHELFRSWRSALALWRFDPAPFQPVLDQLTNDGITITNVNDEARGGTGWLPKLHALHTTLRADVPNAEGYTSIPIERFAQIVGGRPESLSKAFFIAKADELYIGESYLQRGNQPDTLEQVFTGVLPEYRERGIALVLKLHAAIYAQDEGYGRIVTWSESTNPAIAAVNRKLGFVQTIGTVWYEKRL